MRAYHVNRRSNLTPHRPRLDLTFVLECGLSRPKHLADRVPRHLQVTCDLLDRLALDEVLASYPRNRLHDKHPRPPASFESRQPNRPTYRGSILDADPPAQGVNIAGRMTPRGRFLHEFR